MRCPEVSDVLTESPGDKNSPVSRLWRALFFKFSEKPFRLFKMHNLKEKHKRKIQESVCFSPTATCIAPVRGSAPKAPVNQRDHISPSGAGSSDRHLSAELVNCNLGLTAASERCSRVRFVGRPQ